MPELYIITGSNGAGKSTVGADYLPSHIQQQGQFFDGDKLFMQKKANYGIQVSNHTKNVKNWLSNL